MRIAVVNPTKKKSSKKAHRSPKQLAAARKNIKKAQAAKKAKASKKHSPKKSSKKSGKTRRKKASKKSSKKKAHRTAKQKAASRRNIKHAQAAKKKGKKRRSGGKHKKSSKKSKAKKKSKKSKAGKGKRHRPVMYHEPGTKVLKHSKKSRLAKRGFRFNPSMRGMGKHVVPIRQGGAKGRGVQGAVKGVMHAVKTNPISTIVGGAGGFYAAGYVGGQLGNFAVSKIGDNLLSDGVSVVGNVIGAEVPAMAVHYLGKKARVEKYATPLARGMRIGGYLALGLNLIGIGLRAFNVPVPYRQLGSGSSPNDIVLSGVGDMDLALPGLAGLGAASFEKTADYAALGPENEVLDDEIAALSAYNSRPELDEFAGVIDGSGRMP